MAAQPFALSGEPLPSRLSLVSASTECCTSEDAVLVEAIVPLNAVKTRLVTMQVTYNFPTGRGSASFVFDSEREAASVQPAEASIGKGNGDKTILLRCGAPCVYVECSDALLSDDEVETELMLCIPDKVKIEGAELGQAIQFLKKSMCACPTRLLRHRDSEELILIAIRDNMQTVTDLKAALQPFVYPWTTVSIVGADIVSDDYPLRDCAWTLSFELSRPSRDFERDILVSEMNHFIKQSGLEEMLLNWNLGYLDECDKKNPFYPAYSGLRGHVGIVVTPKPSFYEEFERTGCITGLPKRLRLAHGLGTIPISVQNPRFLQAEYAIS